MAIGCDASPFDPRLVGFEVDAIDKVSVGKTLDRSVTGQLVDFATALPYYLPVNGWDAATLRVAEDKLTETQCLANRPFDEVIFPERAAVRLLEATWPLSRARH